MVVLTALLTMIVISLVIIWVKTYQNSNKINLLEHEFYWELKSLRMQINFSHKTISETTKEIYTESVKGIKSLTKNEWEVFISGKVLNIIVA